MLFTNLTELIVLLVVCAIAAACFVAAIVLLIWAVRNQKRKQKGARELIELVADCNAVKSEFTLGEEFTCDGLIVNALYNRRPKSEVLTQFDVLTEDEYERLTGADAANGLCVIKPNMADAGRAIVIIKYKGKATYYSIMVAESAQEPIEEVPQEPVQEEIVQEEPVREEVSQEEPAPEEPQDEPAEEEPAQEEILSAETSAEEEPVQEIIVRKREPIVIEEESYEGVLRYNKSFTAKYIQSRDEIKNWYTALKNELLSYRRVKARMSWKRETFRIGKNVVARLAFRGNTLCLYLPLNPADYAETKYKVQDVSDSSSYADTPCMYRLKGERRIRYAVELIATVMENMGGVRTERISEDYYLPNEGIVELIEKGLAKRTVQKRSGPKFLQVHAAEAAATDITSSDEPAEKQEQTAEAQPTATDEVTEEVAPAEEQAEQAEQMLAEEVAPAEEQALIDEVLAAADEVTEEVAPAEEQAEQAEEMPAEEDASAIEETPDLDDISEESTLGAEEAAADGTVEAADAAENASVSDQPIGQHHGNGKRRKRHKRRR